MAKGLEVQWFGSIFNGREWHVFCPQKPGFVQRERFFHQPRIVSNVKLCGVFHKKRIFAAMKENL